MRNVGSSDTTSTINSESSGGMNYMFDLSSQNIRRYIIEDIMSINVGELVSWEDTQFILKRHNDVLWLVQLLKFAIDK